VYTALSDNMVGDLWASLLSCLRSPSIYKYVLYVLSLYVWHVNFCRGMLHCLCSGLVEIILIMYCNVFIILFYVILLHKQ
jgi:hypothetical protein